MSIATLKRAHARLEAGWQTVEGSLRVFASDVGHGLLEVSHNMLAVLGLLLVGAVVYASGHRDARHALEAQTLSWLQARHEARVQVTSVAAVEPDLGEPDAIARATASDPKDLSRAQAAVAMWISRRYHVAPEPVSRLVQEAWNVGAATNLDPTLILAVMAVESNFNPFAQSAVGAQGLMQVMTKVHDAKYEAFGGSHAAFDPVTNLRVGVQVLKECIARSGSLEGGLRAYVGAANTGEDGGYAAKVLAEQNTLRLVAGGAKISTVAVAPAARAPRVETPEVPAATPDAPKTDEAPAAPTTDKIALLR